jgi:cytochrome oxidase Cu insertion factor (SCO1/SenC/PrrC family)
MIGLLVVACLTLFSIRRSGPRFSDRPGSDSLQVLHEIPEFQLLDQAGAAFGAEQLRGRVWAANVIFTRCVTICPRITKSTTQLQHLTQDLGGRFHLVSFTADPEHDRPAVLAEFATQHGARPESWSFLTGDRPVIQATVVEGLRIHLADEVPSDDAAGDAPVADISHSPHFVLVDERMRVRGYYDSGEADAVLRLSRDARRLVLDLPGRGSDAS